MYNLKNNKRINKILKNLKINLKLYSYNNLLYLLYLVILN
jgi:hypothetical protein